MLLKWEPPTNHNKAESYPQSVNDDVFTVSNLQMQGIALYMFSAKRIVVILTFEGG